MRLDAVGDLTKKALRIAERREMLAGSLRSDRRGSLPTSGILLDRHTVVKPGRRDDNLGSGRLELTDSLGVGDDALHVIQVVSRV